ncbi:Peptidase family M50 [Candidatus Tiddalikarchaeum anstoanum]|nr:Peptidase family M50 [Candidatus Tiddalikarchaeum anstoanum]
MNWELITALIFYIALGLIIYFNRRKVQILDKIFITYRWEKGVKYIKKIAGFGTIIFRIISAISIPVAVFFMFFGVQMLFQSAMTIAASPVPKAGISVVIPGVRLPGSDLYVPFWYGIISIIIIAIVHELSHGIVSVAEGVKLKSTGVGLLLIFPVAFVEPDNDSLKKSSRLSRIKVYCAGSFANILVAVLMGYLAINIVGPIIDSQVDYTNVIIQSAMPDLPAALAGVPNNSYLEKINNETITNVTEFYNALTRINPGENITLVANGTNYYLTATQNPDNASMPYLGVFVEQGWKYKDSFKNVPELLLMIPFFLYNLFIWVSNLNFSVGIFNLIPIWITDGGKVLSEILSIFLKDKLLFYVINYIFLAVLSLILFNFFGPQIMSLVNFALT